LWRAVRIFGVAVERLNKCLRIDINLFFVVVRGDASISLFGFRLGDGLFLVLL
jgi:hypothetical protein